MREMENSNRSGTQGKQAWPLMENAIMRWDEEVVREVETFSPPQTVELDGRVVVVVVVVAASSSSSSGD